MNPATTSINSRSMALETGLYTIKNGEKLVGRALAEDLSLLPKRIILTESERTSIVGCLLRICLLTVYQLTICLLGTVGD